MIDRVNLKIIHKIVLAGLFLACFFMLILGGALYGHNHLFGLRIVSEDEINRIRLNNGIENIVYDDALDFIGVGAEDCTRDVLYTDDTPYIRNDEREFVAPALFYNGIRVPYDNYAGCYLLNVGDEDRLGGRLFVQKEEPLYFERDAYTNDIADGIRGNHLFTLHYMSENNDYILRLIMTKLPVINVDIAGNSAVFDKGNGILLGEDIKEIKEGVSGKVITVKLDDKKRLLGFKKADNFKIVRLCQEDSTYIRQALSVDIWNEINTREELKQEGKLVELLFNGRYKGMCYFYPKEYDGEEIIASQRILNNAYDNKNEFMSFIQAIEGYDNITDNILSVDLSKKLDGEDGGLYLAPKRVDYCFGNMPPSLGYLSYGAENRVIDFYNNEEGAEETLIRAWRDYRKGCLDNSYINSMVDEYAQMLTESGYELRKAYYDTLDRSVRISMEKDVNVSDIFDIAKMGSKEKAEENGVLRSLSRTVEEDVGYFVPEDVSYIYNEEINRLKEYILKRYEYIDRAYENPGQLLAEVGDGIESYPENKKPDAIKTGIPSIYIETFNGTMEYVDSKKGRKEPGRITVYDENGLLDMDETFDAIKVRGHSSSTQSKKPYRINLSNACDILGMGESDAYLLIANAADASNIRNQIMFTLADDMGIDYVSDRRYVNVYLNGEYNGLYLLMEPIDVDTDKGTVLYEAINRDYRLHEGDQYFAIGQGEDRFYFSVREPEGLTDSQIIENKDYLNEINDLIEGCNTSEEYDALCEKIDIESFALMYIMDELSNDIDSGWFSTFYYYDPADKKLHAGPVWDYDKCLGNDPNRGLYPRFDCFYRTWPEVLAENSDFQALVRKLYDTRVKALVNDMINNKIDQFVDEIYPFALANEEIYKSKTTTFSENIEYTRNYLIQRLLLLEQILYNREECHKVSIVNDKGRAYWCMDGDTIPQDIIDYIEKLYGGKALYTEDGSRLDSGDVISRDMILYLQEAE